MFNSINFTRKFLVGIRSPICNDLVHEVFGQHTSRIRGVCSLAFSFFIFKNPLFPGHIILFTDVLLRSQSALFTLTI